MMYNLLIFVLLLATYIIFNNAKQKIPKEQQYTKEESTSPLSQRQIQVIRESWQKVLPIKEKAAELFYGRLFTLDPSVKPLFKGKLDYQGDKLMLTLNVIVNALDDLSEVNSMLQAMGERHIIYGVQAAHYETVGAALIWVLEQGLGDAFTDETREAWLIAYDVIASTMKQAAYTKSEGSV